MVELVWALVGFVLTIMVFSYLFGDNILFRIATYIFVGVSAGYAFVVVFYHVLLPRLIEPLLLGSMLERALLVIPLIMAGLLLTKISPRLASLGKMPMAFLVGVGAAVAVGGAVFGTLLGQVRAAASPFSQGVSRAAEGLVALAGTIGTLAFFQFGAAARGAQPAQRPAWIEGLALVGQVFIGITLGALFAGVYAAALTALLDRVQSLLFVIAKLIQS